jgi:NAD(P)-dependent dehydrogenase (short-subunit alcohol dehydrogenase family)
MQFATNFMGHFALTTALHGALAAAQGARIVSVSSSGNLFSPVVFEDLHFDFRPYDPLAAYGQSKTAEALLAVEATRRWSGEGIYANALTGSCRPPGCLDRAAHHHRGRIALPMAPAGRRGHRAMEGTGASGPPGARRLPGGAGMKAVA